MNNHLKQNAFKFIAPTFYHLYALHSLKKKSLFITEYLEKKEEIRKSPKCPPSRYTHGNLWVYLPLFLPFILFTCMCQYVEYSRFYMLIFNLFLIILIVDHLNNIENYVPKMPPYRDVFKYASIILYILFFNLNK